MIAKHIAAAMRALGPALSSLMEAVLLIAGATAVATGAWMAYKPAGPIVGGALLITGVILRARGS